MAARRCRQTADGGRSGARACLQGVAGEFDHVTVESGDLTDELLEICVDVHVQLLRAALAVLLLQRLAQLGEAGDVDKGDGALRRTKKA